MTIQTIEVVVVLGHGGYQGKAYLVYRSSAPSGPWTRIASNVVDMDEGTPNHQYVDQNGGGGSTWYYENSAFSVALGASASAFLALA